MSVRIAVITAQIAVLSARHAVIYAMNVPRFATAAENARIVPAVDLDYALAAVITAIAVPPSATIAGIAAIVKPSVPIVEIIAAIVQNYAPIVMPVMNVPISVRDVAIIAAVVR